MHFLRCGGDLNQCAVDIKQECGAFKIDLVGPNGSGIAGPPLGE
ncbi:MAG TPA: hypothetical protein VHG27_05010 [Xanthobacteraceae bacterium]|nr:hypothetical protein [Xanthobacteraceae bacterium]